MTEVGQGVREREELRAGREGGKREGGVVV